MIDGSATLADSASVASRLLFGIERGDHTAVAVTVADLAGAPDEIGALVRAASELDIVLREIDHSDENALLVALLGELLRRSDRRLGVLRALEDRRQRAAQARSVRGRVLTALRDDGPARPADLSDRLSMDVTQVARALRELRDDGLVERAVAPGQQMVDRRAVWYQAARAQAIRPQD